MTPSQLPPTDPTDPTDPTGHADHLSALVERLVVLAPRPTAGERRRVLGIAGPPGAGKTTLVLALLAAAEADPRLRGRIAHLPMDGFHLTNAELDRLGRRERKGAPDTFDAAAYTQVLAAARELPRRVVAAPAFDHTVGEPEPGAIEVALGADLLLTEGNYLLLDDPAWLPVRALLDEAWFCTLDDDLRRSRLVGATWRPGARATTPRPGWSGPTRPTPGWWWPVAARPTWSSSTAESLKGLGPPDSPDPAKTVALKQGR